jgi:hypothetical protein
MATHLLPLLWEACESYHMERQGGEGECNGVRGVLEEGKGRSSRRSRIATETANGVKRVWFCARQGQSGFKGHLRRLWRSSVRVSSFTGRGAPNQRHCLLAHGANRLIVSLPIKANKGERVANISWRVTRTTEEVFFILACTKEEAMDVAKIVKPASKKEVVKCRGARVSDFKKDGGE